MDKFDLGSTRFYVSKNGRLSYNTTCSKWSTFTIVCGFFIYVIFKQIIPWYDQETYTYQVEAMEAPTNLTENGIHANLIEALNISVSDVHIRTIESNTALLLGAELGGRCSWNMETFPDTNQTEVSSIDDCVSDCSPQYGIHFGPDTLTNKLSSYMLDGGYITLDCESNSQSTIFLILILVKHNTFHLLLQYDSAFQSNTKEGYIFRKNLETLSLGESGIMKVLTVKMKQLKIHQYEKWVGYRSKIELHYEKTDSSIRSYAMPSDFAGWYIAAFYFDLEVMSSHIHIFFKF